MQTSHPNRGPEQLVDVPILRLLQYAPCRSRYRLALFRP
jgi:hypothetical protein